MKRTFMAFLSLCMFLIFPWSLAGQKSPTILTPPIGIGTSTPDSSVLEELTGGAQLFVPLSSQGTIYHYTHLISYTNPGIEGTMEIILPAGIAPNGSGGSNGVNEVNMTIDGYVWPWGAWKIQVGGFPGFGQCSYAGTYPETAWCGAGASITGAFPYSYLRLGYDTSLSRFVVLLGNTITYWDDPTVEVTDATFNGEDFTRAGLGAGWSIAILASETAIQDVNTIYNSSNHLVVGPTAGEGITGTGNGTDPTVSFEVLGGSSLSVPVTPANNAALSNNPFHHYRDLFGFSSDGQTGDFEIVIPNSGADMNSVSMTISSPNWQITVGGIEDFGNNIGWSYYSSVASGSPPLVRLAYDTSLNEYVVVLGTTTQYWPFQTIEVTDYVEGQPNRPLTPKGSGWVVNLLASEANLSNIVTPSFVSITGATVAASKCGSLTNAAGCFAVNVSGVTHYVPYW